ncbi:acyltransferase family protein [Paracoccus aerius]|uniref:Acyltransferase n=1 Tax=Paracoccus aerius TaxID=1915382 RepID=A0ABS1SA70_9RHOB|nr:acyltransferase [Paracoccus aerius]MBL3675619.1 acyltransferase [Paracoccus aerius]
MREYPAFDWLRLVLASVVFWVHAGFLQSYSAAGNFAVQVFFALSGWLIGGIIMQMTASDFPRFFYNRVTRIWLPYVAAVALLYLTAVVKDGFAPYFWENLAYDLTLTHNLFIQKVPAVVEALPMGGTGAHLWSIAVEEQFYLMAPLLIVLTPLGKSWTAWAFVTAFAILLGTWYGSVSAGVLAVMLQRRFGDWHLTNPATAFLVCLGVLTGSLLMAGLANYQYAAPIVAVVVVLLLARPGERRSIGIWAGGISYPMYLNHWTGLFAASALVSLLPQLGRFTAATGGFVFALIVSTAAYSLIDRNVQRYRGQFYTAGLGRSAMISAYVLMAVGLILGNLVIGPLSASASAP